MQAAEVWIVEHAAGKRLMAREYRAHTSRCFPSCKRLGNQNSIFTVYLSRHAEGSIIRRGSRPTVHCGILY